MNTNRTEYVAFALLVYVPKENLNPDPEARGGVDEVAAECCDVLRRSIDGARVFDAEDFERGEETEDDDNELSALIVCACPPALFAFGQPALRCPRCGKVNEFVNQCACDPNNLPTVPDGDARGDGEAPAQCLSCFV